MKLLPMADPLAEIRRIYFTTTRATIGRDFTRALELLKGMASEDERSRATVFMHGLAQMRADWTRKSRHGDGGAGTQHDRGRSRAKR
jgi:hypothetical protein